MSRLTDLMQQLDFMKMHWGEPENQCLAEEIIDETIAELEKLADYEDKQEQGLLIDVPVKPEDDIYFIKLHFNGASRLGKITVDKITIDAFEIRVCGYWHDWEQEVSFTLKEFNKTWFLTRSEAEEALAKMGGK